MKRIVAAAIAISAISGPALAQTSAEQLNAAEYQRLQTGAPAQPMPAPPMMRGAQQCPPGYYWEDAGYEHHAKWRPAHCARI